MRFFTRLIYALFIAAIIPVGNAAATEFPLREKYSTVPAIEMADLYAMKDNLLIVDVRSRYEYETLHIKNAINLPVDDYSFIDSLRDLRRETAKPIVVYCNGHTCRKSYDAAFKASQASVADVLVFDAGIFDWAKAHGDDAVLLGKSPVLPTDLIPKEKFDAHLLSPDDFGERTSQNAIVLDVRDVKQVDLIKLFPMIQRLVPLDNDKLARYVKEAKEGGKTLLVYDAVGKQVQWLQYYLEKEGVKDYFFMKGGAKAFLQY